MKRKIADFLRKYNIFDIFVLSGGLAISQVIKFIVQPIATRLYSPAEFGIFSLILDLTNMFAVFSSFQYDLCIVSAKTDESADKVTGLCMYLLTATSLVFLLGLFGFNQFSPETYREAGFYIYFSVVFFFLTGFCTIINHYNNRYGEYKLMSSASIYNSGIYAVSKVTLGWLGAGPIGLIVSHILSYIFSITKQATGFFKNIKRIFSVTPSEMKTIIRENIAQPIFHTPSLFLLTYSFSVIPLYLMSLYGNLSEIGYYSQATTILALPLNMISSSVSKVFFKNACDEMNQTGYFKKSFRNTVILLLCVSVLPFLLIYWLAPWGFGFLFGENWVRSGYFARLMLPLYATNFISTTVSCGLVIRKKQSTSLILHSLFLVASLATYYISKAMALPIEHFLLITSITYAVLYTAKVLMVFKYSKDKIETDN